MTTLQQYRLDRVLTIGARPETVFSFFTDSSRWASWWGAGSTIDPRLGGAIRIVNPGGVEVVGEILEIQPPERIIFTYGFAKGAPIAPGGSRVTIRLAPHDEGTQLHLTHDFPDQASRDEHVQGWRFQLALFANAVANLAQTDAESVVDRWFGAWNGAEPVARLAVLSTIAAPDVRFCDRYSRTDGIDELNAHLDAARRFMPGVVLTRQGAVRHCQGTALADWVVLKDGAQVGQGTSVFEFDPDGRLRHVTGLWG
jgi:uncharacterized protein YndB with AHSA1/START domain